MTDKSQTARSFWLTPLPNAGMAFAWMCFALGICFGGVVGFYLGVQFR